MKRTSFNDPVGRQVRVKPYYLAPGDLVSFAPSRYQRRRWYHLHRVMSVVPQRTGDHMTVVQVADIDRPTPEWFALRNDEDVTVILGTNVP